MIEGSLSRRYTKALFQLAQEGAQEEQIGRELDSFLAAYAGSPLQAVLNNPTFEAASRMKILVEVTKALQLSPLTVQFLSLLLERGRLTYLVAIGFCYRRFLNEAKGRVEANVVGAEPLEPAMLEKLREVLHGISGKEVLLHEESDPALVGGVLVQLDGTVRTQLEKMKQRIARGY
jgi:F-type H+-transporting ATPase subunit delta